MEDEAAEAASAPAVDLRDRASLPSGNSVDVILDLISVGAITPQFSANEVESAGVNPTCLNAGDNVTSGQPYALANLTTFGGADRLALVEFADDGMSRVLDAEDCSLLG